MAVHTTTTIAHDLASDDGGWLDMQGIPRSYSPDSYVHPPHHYNNSNNDDDDASSHAPDLSSSASSAVDTPSCSTTSSTVSQTTKVPPQPIKKHSRLHNMLHNAGGHIRAGLRMTPLSSSSDQDESAKPRRGSTASSQQHSYGSSVGSTWSKLSSSWKHHSTPQSQPGSNSPPPLPRLADKYGSYIKPDQQRTFKGMGATSKKNIGSGATAVIRLVRHNGQILAVKEFKKREKNESERDYEKRMRNEYCISKTVSGHRNVVSTIDLVKDERDRWCTVMEYCSGGDLFNLLQERPSMSPMEHACLFKQLLLGLQHLHQLGIAHRDIKPENLVLSEHGTLRICDFGTADIVQTCFESCPRRSHKWCGSEPFWSPEIWTLKDENDSYDGRAFDVWSAAITYMCMRTHMLPFHASFYTGRPNGKPPADAKPGSPADVAARAQDGGDEEYGHYCQQRRDGHVCDLFKDLSEPERECIHGMLDPDPATRLTVDQALETPWIQSVEMCDDGHLPNGWRHYHCRPSSSSSSSSSPAVKSDKKIFNF